MIHLKNNLLTVFLPVLFLVFTGRTACTQTFYAEYSIYAHQVLPLSEDSPFFGLIDIPVEVTAKYEVFVDADYLYVKGKILDRYAPDSVTVNASDSSIIIDRKSGIVYHTEDKRYERILTYKLSSKGTSEDTCTIANISGFDDRYKVTTCTDIPFLISPAIIFTNLINGVRKVDAPNFTITLSKFNTIPDTLDYRSYFQHIDPDTIKAEYRSFLIEDK